MKRREFIAGLCGAAAWPVVARAQQDRLRVVGLLLNGAPGDPDMQARLAVVRDGLQKLGWTGGRNLRLEVRWDTTSSNLAESCTGSSPALAPLRMRSTYDADRR